MPVKTLSTHQRVLPLRYITIAVAMAMLTISNTAYAQQCNQYQHANISPLAESTTVQLISDDFLFLEGPTWSALRQTFYFSEMNFNGSQHHGPDSTIYSWSPDTGVTTFFKHSGSNGLLAVEESMLVMDHANRALSAIDLTQSTPQIKPRTTDYKGLKFNSPNDIARHSSGKVYFTDPDWQLSGREQQTPFTGVYSVNVDNHVSLISSDFNKPNGIAISPDERLLYVGDYSNKITVFNLLPQGDVGDQVFSITIQSPDGMAIDCAGNLYASSHSEGVIYVYSSQGEPLNKLHIGPNVTNMAFGGKDMKTLLITTAKGLFRLTTQIPGY